MNRSKHSIYPCDYHQQFGSDLAPTVVDVRHHADVATPDRIVVPALHCSPDEVERRREDLPSGRPVVPYRFHRQEVGQGVAAALRVMGIELPAGANEDETAPARSGFDQSIA